MKKFTVIVFLLVPALHFSQELTAINDLSILHRLTGTWEYKSGKSITIEKWEKISPQTFEGISYVRKIGDLEPNFSESLRMLNMKGEVFYLAKVDHNEMPVPFKLISNNAGNFIFENMDHDFPQRITYTFTSPDSLSVNVWGNENNNIKEFTVPYIRVK